MKHPATVDLLRDGKWPRKLGDTAAEQRAQRYGHGRCAELAEPGLFDKLCEFDVCHVTYVPDSGHARLIELCHAP